MCIYIYNNFEVDIYAYATMYNVSMCVCARISAYNNIIMKSIHMNFMCILHIAILDSFTYTTIF